MIGSTRSVRVFAYTVATDMRKGMDGLYGLVTSLLAKDPLSGDLFLFVSRDRKRAKVLLWDGTGLCLYAKRLERGQVCEAVGWGGGEHAGADDVGDVVVFGGQPVGGEGADIASKTLLQMLDGSRNACKN